MADDLDNYSEHILDIVTKNVKYYRELKGFSQIKLALEIGMSGGAYLGKYNQIIKHNKSSFRSVVVQGRKIKSYIIR